MNYVKTPNNNYVPVTAIKYVKPDGKGSILVLNAGGSVKIPNRAPEHILNELQAPQIATESIAATVKELNETFVNAKQYVNNIKQESKLILESRKQIVQEAHDSIATFKHLIQKLDKALMDI